VETKQSSQSSQSQIEQGLNQKIAKLDREIEELRKEARGKQALVEEMEGRLEQEEKEREQLRAAHSTLLADKTKLGEQVKKGQEREKEQAKALDSLKNDLKQRELAATQQLDELRRQLEQVELDKGNAAKRLKEKDKKISGLESKIQDLEEEKMRHFGDYQEE
jgi:chromosome segregation ATPase